MRQLISTLKTNRLLAGLGLLLLSGAAAPAATLSVTSSVTPNGALYNYSYVFNVTGTGVGFDNFFLGSNDLSPLNTVIKLDGATDADFSYLGSDTPQNYLQFFSLSATPVTGGNSLGVTFTSSFAPANTGFLIGLNSATSTSSNQLTGVTVPGTVPTPEPASAGAIFLAAGLALVCFCAKRLAL